MKRRAKVKMFWLPNTGRYAQTVSGTLGPTPQGTTQKFSLIAEDEGAESQQIGGNVVFSRMGPQENLVIDRVVGKVFFRLKNTSGPPGSDGIYSVRAAIVKIPWSAATGVEQEATLASNDLWSLAQNSAVPFLGSEAPRYVWYRSWAVNIGPLQAVDTDTWFSPPAGYVDCKPRCNLRANERLFLVMQASSQPATGTDAPSGEWLFTHDLRVLGHHRKGA